MLPGVDARARTRFGSSGGESWSCRGAGEIDGGAHRHLRAGYVGREQGSLVLNGGGTPLQSRGQCLAAALRAAQIPGEHGVAGADGTHDPVYRRVTPQRPLRRRRELRHRRRDWPTRCGHRDGRTSWAASMTSPSVLRYPAGQFREFVHVGLHQIRLCAERLSASASPDVSTATGTPLRCPSSTTSPYQPTGTPAGRLPAQTSPVCAAHLGRDGGQQSVASPPALSSGPASLILVTEPFGLGQADVAADLAGDGNDDGVQAGGVEHLL